MSYQWLNNFDSEKLNEEWWAVSLQRGCEPAIINGHAPYFPPLLLLDEEFQPFLHDGTIRMDGNEELQQLVSAKDLIELNIGRYQDFIGSDMKLVVSGYGINLVYSPQDLECVFSMYTAMSYKEVEEIHSSIWYS
jgi:hypothetical protein